jgi:hypothetical protein
MPAPKVWHTACSKWIDAHHQRLLWQMATVLSRSLSTAEPSQQSSYDMCRSEPGLLDAVGQCLAGLIWLALIAASAGRCTSYGLRRVRHSRHCNRPVTHTYTSIFATIHVNPIPITINHALELATTWPLRISLRARVLGTWRSKLRYRCVRKLEVSHC